MTFTAFVDLLGRHWVILAIVLCPIVVVLMALAALTCEACGAPFGIFRRRNRTIDLCLRCALVHDFRRASELRKAGRNTDAPPDPSKPQDPQDPESRLERRSENRRQPPQPPAELSVAQPVAH
jgi:hypothetical protein